MAKNTEIKIRISTTTLMLKNCQEVYGHDDSMPYMADLYEVKGVNDEELVHLAKCSNDGWGGDTLVNSVSKEADSRLAEIDAFIKKWYKLYYKQPTRDGNGKLSYRKVELNIDLTYVIDTAAIMCIKEKRKRANITQMDGVEEVEE